MFTRFSSLFALGLSLSSLSLAGRSEAEPLRLHTRVGAALPVSGHQVDELGPGAGLSLGMEMPFVPQLGLAAVLGVLYLSDRDAPQDPGFIDQGPAAVYSGAFALQLRPFASNEPGRGHWLSGLWLSVNLGVGQTGALQRFTSEGSIGLDALIGDGTYALGPYMGLYHVFQPGKELRQANANTLLFGVHMMFDGADRSPPRVGGVR